MVAVFGCYACVERFQDYRSQGSNFLAAGRGPARRSRSGPRRRGAPSRTRDIVAPKDRAREAVPIRSLAARSRRSWQKQCYRAPAVQLGHPPVGTNPQARRLWHMGQSARHPQEIPWDACLAMRSRSGQPRGGPRRTASGARRGTRGSSRSIAPHERQPERIRKEAPSRAQVQLRMITSGPKRA
jgi:hypothetical protein